MRPINAGRLAKLTQHAAIGSPAKRRQPLPAREPKPQVVNLNCTLCPTPQRFRSVELRRRLYDVFHDCLISVRAQVDIGAASMEPVARLRRLGSPVASNAFGCLDPSPAHILLGRPTMDHLDRTF